MFRASAELWGGLARKWAKKGAENFAKPFALDSTQPLLSFGARARALIGLHACEHREAQRPLRSSACMHMPWHHAGGEGALERWTLNSDREHGGGSECAVTQIDDGEALRFSGVASLSTRL